MKTLKDLFEHQLKDLYSAENQLVEALPKLRDAAHNEELKQTFSAHIEETSEHRRKLREICDTLNISPSGEECKAMKGLIKEAEHFLNEETSDEVKDAGLIAEAQRIEHYEIAGYGTAVRYAKELGLDTIAEKLNETLNQEYETDEALNHLAEDRLNRKAIP